MNRQPPGCSRLDLDYMDLRMHTYRNCISCHVDRTTHTWIDPDYVRIFIRILWKKAEEMREVQKKRHPQQNICGCSKDMENLGASDCLSFSLSLHHHPCGWQRISLRSQRCCWSLCCVDTSTTRTCAVSQVFHWVIVDRHVAVVFFFMVGTWKKNNTVNIYKTHPKRSSAIRTIILFGQNIRTYGCCFVFCMLWLCRVG